MSISSIAELPRWRELLSPSAARAFGSVYSVSEETSTSFAPPPLASKYGLSAQHEQRVVVVRNTRSGETVLWNGRRKEKPQTFTGAPASAVQSSKPCDFCAWAELSAVPAWGRYQNSHCVTAANLFSFRGDHGLVVMKHHEPLECSLDQLASLLDAAQQWAVAAVAHKAVSAPGRAESAGTAPAPLSLQLLWNSGPRSGASQYHGHAQLLLTPPPPPPPLAPPPSADVLAAPAALGLSRSLADSRVFASITPLKDCELVLHAARPGSRGFQRLLHASLRALIDRAAVSSFNLSVTGMSVTSLGEAADAQEGVTARLLSRGKAGSASSASDFGALELFGGASIGHTSPWDVIALLDDQLAGRP